MIDISEIGTSEPFRRFNFFYDKASKNNQKSIDALTVCSFNLFLQETDVRIVNLKYIKKNKFIFFTNYKSKKANDFESHPQVSALIFWNTINVQIRIKGIIKKTSSKLSDDHFKKRSLKKNALAISSCQSQTTHSYNIVKKKYEDMFNSDYDLESRPEYWGGYEINPYYFEFWEGNDSRINKREVFKNSNGHWRQSFLQP